MGAPAQLRPRHEAILYWMVSNPTATLREVAAHFQLSYGWICTLVNSDLFQAKLQEKRNEVFISEAEPLRVQLNAAASAGLQRLMDLMPTATSVEEVSVATERITKALGMGNRDASPINVAVQANLVDAELLAQARSAMLVAGHPTAPPSLAAPSPGTEQPAIDGEEAVNLSPASVPASQLLEAAPAPAFDPAAEILGEPATVD